MSKSLIALKPFTYAGRALQAGDSFTAASHEARALCAVRRAAPADTYQTTEAAAEVTKAAPAERKPAAKKAAAKKPASKTAAKKASAKA